jgi:hypothetical protein
MIQRIKKWFYAFHFEPIYNLKLYNNLLLLNHKYPVFPDGSSGNASYLYNLLKILYIKKPKKILELGIGQSSYIINLFCQNHQESICYSIENDLQWYESVSSQLRLKNHIFERVECLLNNNSHYQSMFYDLRLIKGMTFNLITLDGPIGGANRFGILDQIENLINVDDFVIIIDDTNRIIEEKLSTLIEKKLNTVCNIATNSYEIRAKKHQRIICSKNNSFLRTV